MLIPKLNKVFTSTYLREKLTYMTEKLEGVVKRLALAF